MADNPTMGPSTTNPLVKTDAAEDRSALEGAGIVQDFGDAFTTCADGDWAEGLLDAGFGAAGLAEFAADPLAGLASAGIGWLIEHVSFLREPLDWLAGDQDALENMVGTWENIGKEMAKVGADLDKDVKAYAPAWQGTGAEAYRAFAADRADTYAGVAKGAEAVAKLVSMCKLILNVVRGIVRDLISECVAKLISIACRYPGPAVVAGAVAEGVPAAVEYGNKAIKWINKLVRAFNKAKDLFKRLTNIFRKAGKALLPGSLKKLVKTKPVKSTPEFDSASSVKGHWDESPHKVGGVFKDVWEKGKNSLDKDAEESFRKDFQKDYQKEKWKERGEKVDEYLGGDDEDGEDKKDQVIAPGPPPIFGQTGGKSIQGRIE